MSAILDWASELHPYECDGYGFCSHCDRKVSAVHDPATCDLCDPEYDGRPNASRPSGEDTHSTPETD